MLLSSHTLLLSNNLLGTGTSFLAGGSESPRLRPGTCFPSSNPTGHCSGPPTCGRLEPRPLRREPQLGSTAPAQCGWWAERERERSGSEGSEPGLLRASSPPGRSEVVKPPSSPPPPSKVNFATLLAGSAVLVAVPPGGGDRRQGPSASPGVGPWAPWTRRRWSGTPCSSRGWQCSATTKAATLRRCFTTR